MIINQHNSPGEGVKKAFHPDGLHEISFTEKNHRYIDNLGNKYVSVTSFLKGCFKKFDSVKIAKACSKGINPKYSGRDYRDILSDWKKEAIRGTSEGTNVHEYAEYWGAPPGKSIKPMSDRCKLVFNQVDIAYRKLLLQFKFIAAEIIVFSPKLRIAGTIDLLFYDQETNEIIIIDWKTNKTISTENLYQKCLSPIEHLQETDINKYGLQLSLYQHVMIKENYFPKAKGYRRALIHLTATSATPIKLEYYEYEINRMVEYNETYKKT